MIPGVIDLSEKLALITEQWSPKIISQIEDYQFKLAKLEGDFVWHSHPDTDEVFIVLKGQLRIDFRDGAVTLTEGQMLIVPKTVEHKPYAESECHVMVLVQEGTLNTGDAPRSDRTASSDLWV